MDKRTHIFQPTNVSFQLRAAEQNYDVVCEAVIRLPICPSGENQLLRSLLCISRDRTQRRIHIIYIILSHVKQHRREQLTTFSIFPTGILSDPTIAEDV